MLLLWILCSHSLTRIKKLMVQSSATLTFYVQMLQSLNCLREGTTHRKQYIFLYSLGGAGSNLRNKPISTFIKANLRPKNSCLGLIRPLGYFLKLIN